MDQWVIQFRVGVVVVAAAIITVILILMFGAWPNVLQPQYTVHIKFPQAPGITVGTPVRKSGVLIGRVSEVELLDDESGSLLAGKGRGVLVSTRVDRDRRLQRSEICRIGAGSLLGDAVLEFVPMGEDELLARFDTNRNGALEPSEEALANEFIGDGDYLTEGIVANNPLQVLVNLEGDMLAALDSIEGAGNEVNLLAKNLNRSVGSKDDQFERILTKTESSLDRFQATMVTLQSVVGDPEMAGKLKTALDELPVFVAEARATMQDARKTLSGFQRVGSLAETNLENMKGLTEPLRDNGEELVENVNRSTRNLNELLAQLVVFSETLNSGQGTMGKLVHDDQLYQRIEQIIDNVEEVTVKLKPIIGDVRIFTDKIARDPRQLGVKGALDRRPSGIKSGVIR